ncbi:MAG TPA: DNA mismatch repair endonuclease MutL [Candidatus Deferrimicrobium sp.]|nr:DNA mismatch repair endonuclease MutL [Candidatus Deferrimicrobium sp.]
MGKIKVLDEKTRLKIAAGEVVQNPASVVKEVLENAIDAHSTKIMINIQKGGKHLIEVIDDGIGMSPDDVEIAFQRYSTSKISDFSDLESIQTLGFRGEALASIAAVSQVELITKEHNSLIGTRKIVEGSKIIKIEQAERADGTTIRVQNLFYNVPARLKFLRTSTAEFQSILEVITNYSLLYAPIHFILTHDETEILNSPAVSNILDKIFYVYGKDIAKNMIPIEYTTDLIKIFGYVSNSVIQRGTRKFYSIFINKRLIKSQIIIDAIDEAYKTILPKNRHPLIVLSIDINPAMIDVNVHPTKQEVKFSQERLLFETIQKVILDSFDRSNLIPKIPITQKQVIVQKSEPKPIQKTESKPIQKTEPEISQSIPQPISIQQKLIPKTDIISSDKPNKSITTADSIPISKLPPVEIVGQTHNLFIIATDQTNLYIIDQHAAHERIMYEKFLKKLEAGALQTQTLLSPITIEFPLQDSITLQSKLEILKDFGFEIEPFGKKTYRIIKLPIILGKTIKKEDIQLIIDELLAKIDPASKKIPSQNEIAQLYGCKAAIKAGDKLTHAQMENIYRELQKTENPYVCAHNRPTIITFPKDELERKFHR